MPTWRLLQPLSPWRLPITPRRRFHRLSNAEGLAPRELWCAYRLARTVSVMGRQVEWAPGLRGPYAG
jgi:hypothetical protein